MGSYANIKSRRFLRFISWLGKNKKVYILPGGKHNYKVTCIQSGDSFPIPSSHGEINKHIVKDFKSWLTERNICSAAEYEAKL
jgi:hypothetical protein